MTDKVAFFYENGTNPIILTIASLIGSAVGQAPPGEQHVPGLNGRIAMWLDGSPNNDIFHTLLDPEIFEAKKLWYPALGVPMSLSMTIGINNMVAAINGLPKGQKFAIGGYSQGAGCASSVMEMLRPGGSLYSSRGADFIGGVCFGNPRRQINYRGEVGGTWSGAWDEPGSSTGSGGSFSDTGPFPRLTNCDPTKWIEFVDYDDIIAATGTTSANGLGWTQGTDWFLELANPITWLNTLLNAPQVITGTLAAIGVAGATTPFIDAVGKAVVGVGAGHGCYPWRPPPGDPDNGLTSFQIGIKWLTAKALESATAPLILPSIPNTPSPTNAGWSTTLLPPAA